MGPFVDVQTLEPLPPGLHVAAFLYVWLFATLLYAAYYRLKVEFRGFSPRLIYIVARALHIRPPSFPAWGAILMPLVLLPSFLIGLLLIARNVGTDYVVVISVWTVLFGLTGSLLLLLLPFSITLISELIFVYLLFVGIYSIRFLMEQLPPQSPLAIALAGGAYGAVILVFAALVQAFVTSPIITNTFKEDRAHQTWVVTQAGLLALTIAYALLMLVYWTVQPLVKKFS